MTASLTVIIKIMYAIVEIKGQQFKVEKEQKIFVHRLGENEGETVTFENVLLTDNDGKIKVGTPYIKGVSVTAKVLEHTKADKIKIFKKKRRKGFKKSQGHRQYLTQIQIENIRLTAPKKKKEETTEEIKEEKE